MLPLSPASVPGRARRLQAIGRDLDPTTNAELLARFGKGDQAAWLALVARFERLVYSVPIRTGVDLDDAADITQSTFAALLRSHDRISDPERLGSWLTTVARRLTWRVIEQRRRETPRSDHLDGDLEFRSLIEFDHSESFARDADVYDAIRRLSPSCREVITRLFLTGEEPSYAELSQTLGRPIGSIGPTRQRCLERLRIVLEETQG